MIQKSALTGLSHEQALFRFNQASTLPGAVVEMIEQDDGRFTVTVVWDDSGAPLTREDLAAFDRDDAPAPAPAPRGRAVTPRAAAVPRGLAAAVAAEPPLGSLSSRFESNGRPGAIGRDSTGGWSYGAYQIAAGVGTMKAFLDFLAARFGAYAARLQAAGGDAGARSGTAAFREAWQALAADPGFLTAQHDFIGATHYEPFARRLAAELALDLAPRTLVLKDVAWSVAVQHGPGNKLFHRALQGLQPPALDDRDIVQRVYAERLKVDVYFARSTPQVKAGVAARFQAELALALQRLG